MAWDLWQHPGHLDPWREVMRALGLDPNDVIAENVNKLKSRYPGGSFDAHYSENRKDGDL